MCNHELARFILKRSKADFYGLGYVLTVTLPDKITNIRVGNDINSSSIIFLKEGQSEKV